MEQQTRDRAALQTRTVCLAIQTTECITAFKSEMPICLFEEESTKNLVFLELWYCHPSLSPKEILRFLTPSLLLASFFAVQLEMFYMRTLLLHLWNKSLILNITKDKRTHDGGNMWWLDN